MGGADGGEAGERAFADAALLADKTHRLGRLVVSAHRSPQRYCRGEARLRRGANTSRAPHRSLEIFHFVERPDFDFGRTGHRIGAALHPVNRLLEALDLPDPKA